MQLGKEHLQVLNQIVQALPLEERLNYLVGLERTWEEIQSSQFFFVDERDYNIYSVVHIGEQYWLGENLRYEGVKHQKNPNNPNLLYGCLYDWDTVMGELVPEGWHLPSDEEWKELELTLGMSAIDVLREDWREDIGRELKSSYGWLNDGNGSNSSRFNALPAGLYLSDSFFSLGEFAVFWSSTEESSTNVCYRLLSYSSDRVTWNDYCKSGGFSCRCLLN